MRVDSEYDLESWTEKLKEIEINYAIFREPDIGNQMTSIAAVTDSDVFSELRLL